MSVANCFFEPQSRGPTWPTGGLGHGLVSTPWPMAYNPTTWEFTFAGGPQCKKTVVSYDRTFITFNECTDGHSRTCYL